MTDGFSPLRLQDIARLLDGVLTGPDAAVDEIGIDSRRLPSGALFVALTGPNFDGHDFIAAARERGAVAALVSRTVADPLPQIRVADTRLALGQLGAAWRSRFAGPLIALTGSNGKTTLKEMIAAILRQRGPTLATEGNLNNDLGAPLTLLRLRAEHAYAVIELGANHPGEIAYLTSLAQPDVAIINNAGPCHLEGFGDVAGVARAKGELFQGLASTGAAIINHDDPHAEYWASLNPGRRIIDFGLDQPAAVSGRILDPVNNRFRLITPAGEIEVHLPLPGRHNVRNALAAAAAALAVGATLTEIGEGLENLHGVNGRLQRLPGRHGGAVIHDAYNANPASLAAAVQTVGADPGDKWLVLGDMRELGTTAAELHAESGRSARAAGFTRLYTLGEHSQAAALAFGVGGTHFTELDALIADLRGDLQGKTEALAVLIKGSRGMRMERVVAALVEAGSLAASPEGHG
ncbi:MAG: UDP-N-acetylmuramoyl-tripeptide--D-alanyl-D-alanine ligase [Candidatus Contendobacter sp.]|jgi:UDP-N-acetylmuramoyl-tripeptide--D-alanyl-D-alanine ligase|nr:UDP-N-acetylmuramoyl-tripeptide--D-alanyl-D-alanine ligase [Gammaproteobacteria bacterium]MCC8993341.1 UDP-N-acetylmuramoyl-tripeptide--D-alanyl-D-alanine ligase [Candidatus Contendobacter sp.]